MSPSSAPDQLTIPGLFAIQVASRPDAIAVSCGADRWSYRELDQRADLIAAWLRERGVGAEHLVGLQLDRHLDVIAALLGILKAGAAYIALDVGLPTYRRAQVLMSASPTAFITSDGNQDDIALPTLRLPGGIVEQTGQVVTLPDTATPDSVAYVSFTSGSTGKPKGVVIPHRAVARLALGGYADLGPQETLLHLSPLSFDASTFEIWGALLTGARLALYPPGPLSLDGLASVLAEERVTTLWLAAGLFHRVADRHPQALAGLKQLLAGGDVLNPEHVNKVHGLYPRLRLINGYGPTENTTFTCCHTVSECIQTGSVPIGRPVVGTLIRILDDALRPVPAGTKGDLYVSGAGLARGYLRQPALTAQRFVPDSFSAEPGGRMYQTGDVVRELPTGVLEFIGREDRQVKISGFLVEPGEVEHQLQQVSGVRQAAVATVPGFAGNDHRLVAYLIMDHERGPESDEPAVRMRQELRTVLPSYMIPSSFLEVPEFPLTPNGKIDVKALPVPRRVDRQVDADYLAPHTGTERLLCDLWSEHLGVDVGTQDDFFELGGNSLLAMDLIGRTESVFGVQLPIRTLLYNPRVEEFACAIDTLLAQEAGAK